jgi:hypothetical protein
MIYECLFSDVRTGRVERQVSTENKKLSAKID